MTDAIATEGLSKRYGTREVLSDLSLTVPAGSVFAYLGRNGAGKTTTIRLLMGLERPTRGHARVLDADAQRLGPRELARIGYVSENQRLPAWMTVAELVAFCRPMYPSWDDALCHRLLRELDLPPAARVGALSRGMQVKAALVCSLAYRPRLLILDEPFGGLDPLVRDELIHGVLELIEGESWTVFLSSHDIQEVQRLADQVGILDAGALRLCEPVSSLEARFRTLEVTLEGDAPESFAPRGGWLAVERAGRTIRLIDSQYEQGAAEAAVRACIPGVRAIDARPLSLREIFVTLARRYRLDEQGSDEKEERS